MRAAGSSISRLLALVVLIALVLVACEAHNTPESFTVKNAYGGRWHGAVSHHNSETIAWTGIEYARAKRFDLPHVLKHSGELNATSYGPACVQSPMFLSQLENDTVAEDCLFLNVYAPKSSFGLPKRLPVVMYIHGGAFIFGSGSTKWVNPHTYTKHDVILVSISYRLNLLGFMALPNLPHTNFGLRDQRAAMEWIHANIGAFGGDASQVTLIGDSAGAISILHHLTSTLQAKKPLFHRGILISPGLFAGPELTLDKAHAAYLTMAEELGCAGEPNDVLQCLRALPVTSVRIVSGRLPTPFVTTFPMAGRQSGYPINDNTYFPDVIESLEKGKFDKSVSLIVGSDRDEGTLFASAAFPLIYPDEKLFANMVSRLFGSKAPQVMAQYGPAATGDVRKSVNDLVSHMFVSHAACQVARIVSASPGAALVYRYGNLHHFAHPNNAKLGIFHTAAHGLLVRPALEGMIYPTVLTDSEIAMSEEFGRLLTTFIKGEKLEEAEWPAYNTKTQLELHIGPENSTRLKVGTGFQRSDCDFWARLYPPHGLNVPTFYGDIYQDEEMIAWMANTGFWWLVTRWRFLTSSVLFVVVGLILIGCYRFSPLRSKPVHVADPKSKKVKKD